ncbi:MAG: hypothetical protein COB67_13315 [SAR324 cluster bacterium]|uniref:Uncharacterized protein n=1 Tax=SAR324 cluster bacterium TaxID=2024889 RepID=A0A2A4SNY5_9DELT|nr:MAG: hypothetical protein COB67_13315 [SAR324 cluster bacterium]
MLKLNVASSGACFSTVILLDQLLKHFLFHPGKTMHEKKFVDNHNTQEKTQHSKQTDDNPVVFKEPGADKPFQLAPLPNKR